MRVIRVWDSKCVFPSFFTSQLTSIFISGEKQNPPPPQIVRTPKKAEGEGMTVAMEEKSKNLIYPKHSKLYIAKKGNNPNKAFTASSFQKGMRKKGRFGDMEADDEGASNVFTKMVKGKAVSDRVPLHLNPLFQIKAAGPGQYDGEPLDEAECIDIELL